MTDLEAARAIAARLREALTYARTQTAPVGGHVWQQIEMALSDSQPIADWMADHDGKVRFATNADTLAHVVCLIRGETNGLDVLLGAEFKARDSRVRDAALEEAAMEAAKHGTSLDCDEIRALRSKAVTKPETPPTTTVCVTCGYSGGDGILIDPFNGGKRPCPDCGGKGTR